MAGPGGPAVEVAELLGRRVAGAARGPGGRLQPGGQGPEQRLQAGHHLGLAADHQAVAPLQAEDPAAGADVQVVHAPGPERLGPVDVVAVVGVAAVDHHVAGSISPPSSSTTRPATPAGTITQAARGASSLATSSSREPAPTAPSPSSC